MRKELFQFLKLGLDRSTDNIAYDTSNKVENTCWEAVNALIC